MRSDRSGGVRAIKLPPASFRALCKASGVPLPVEEFRFAAEIGRRWRADYAWPLERVLLEVEGGAWSGGRHTRGSGYLLDMVKYNHMTLLGYKLIRTTPQQLCSEDTIAMLRRLLTPTRAVA